MDLLSFCSVLCLLCLCVRLFIFGWERADLLALVCGVCCEFVTFLLVSWVRCGTWLYRFLIFAPLLTLSSDIFYSTLAFMETINNLFRNVLHLKDLIYIWYTYMLLVNIGGNSFAFANWYTSQRQSQVEERNSLKVSNTISSKSFQK